LQYLVDYMKEKGYAPATIRTELSALRSLYRKAGGKGRLPDNKKLGVPKEERGKENRTWTKEEFEMAITTGGLKVTGKGGRVRTVPVQTEEQKAVVRMPYKYATDNKLQKGDFIISENKYKGVEAKKKSIQSWLYNHRKEFMDKDRAAAVEPGKKTQI